MKNSENAHSEKSGYSIEKTYRKQATPIQKKLDKLRIDYEDLLADTEKAMNKAQKAYEKKLNAHKKRFDKKLDSDEASFTMEKEAIDKEIEALNEKHKKELDAIQNKNTDKLKNIQADIASMEKEKQATAKEIEKTHKKRIENYEKRLELSKKNHNENTRQTQNSLKDALNKLEMDNKTHKETINTLGKTIDARFNTLYTNLEEARATLSQSIKKSDNSLQHALNTYRKEINENIRNFSKELYQYRSAIHQPFLDIDSSAGNIKKQFETYKDTFITNVNQDMKFEQARLKDMLSKTSEEENPEDIKIINKQMELQKLRKDALIEHIKAFEEGIDSTTNTLKTLSSDTLSFLENIFKTFDETIHGLHTNLKAKFDIFQSGSTDLRETLTTGFSKKEVTSFLSEARETIKKTLTLFSRYATNKLDAIKDTTIALLPLYQEADDIRFFLDTEDAQKKIRENREKISVEQQDASLNIDMKQSEKQHELDLMALEEKYSTKDAFLKHMLEKRSLEHKKGILEIKRKSIQANIEVEKEMDVASLEHDLEQARTDIEIAHAEHAKTLQIAIEKQKNALRSLDLQKERDLALVNLETEKKRRQKALKLKTDRNDQALTRKEALIENEKKKVEKRYDDILEKASQTYKEKENAIQEAFEKENTSHQEKLDFIDQALSRETTKARERIEQTETLLNTRKAIISKSYTKELDWLSTHEEALNSESSTLKEILLILSTPKKNSVKQTLDTFIGTLKETHDVIVEQFRASLNRQGASKRQRKSHINKLRNSLDKALESITQKKNDAFTTYDKAVEESLGKIKSQKKLSLSGLKETLRPINTQIQNALKTLYKDIERSMDEGFQTLKQDDEDLIEKAKASSKKAKAKENIRYEETKKPLNEKLEALKQEKDALIKEHKLNRDREISAVDALHKEDLEPLKDAYNKDLEASQALVQEIEEKRERLTESYQERLKSLEDELEASLETLENKSKERIDAVNKRLEDARNIHAFHVENEESKKADIEDSLKKESGELDSAYEGFKAESERKLQASKKTYEKEKTALKDTLKVTIETYETKMLSSSNELDQRIEKVDREIADQIRIKRARKKTLEDQINHDITKLDETLDALAKTLQNDTESLLESLFKDDSVPLDTEEIVEKQDTLLNTYLTSIKEDIKNL